MKAAAVGTFLAGVAVKADVFDAADTLPTEIETSLGGFEFDLDEILAPEMSMGRNLMKHKDEMDMDKKKKKKKRGGKCRGKKTKYAWSKCFMKGKKHYKMMKMFRRFARKMKKVCKKNKLNLKKCSMHIAGVAVMHKAEGMMMMKMVKHWEDMGGKFNRKRHNKLTAKYMKRWGPFYVALAEEGCKKMGKIGKGFCKKRSGKDLKNCKKYIKAKGDKCMEWMGMMGKHKMAAMKCEFEGMMTMKSYMRGMSQWLGLPKNLSAEKVGQCVEDMLMDAKKDTRKMTNQWDALRKRRGIRDYPVQEVMEFYMKAKMRMMGMGGKKKGGKRMKDKM